MLLEKYIAQLCKDLNLAAAASLDERKMQHLTLGTIKVSMRELDPGIYFHSPLAPVPSVQKEELFMLLMKANLIGQGTGGSTIALAEDESFLTLSLGLPYELNYKTFKETLEEFANFADYWKKEIGKWQKQAI